VLRPKARLLGAWLARPLVSPLASGACLRAKADTDLGKIEADLFYIRNWSLLLDARILLRTLFSRASYVTRPSEALGDLESGKWAGRPQLGLALETCRKHKARLVIAKLDRLSRNLAFIATLMEAGVEFVAADMPFASKLTIHILAAVAEHEREAISERTKSALAAAKARGTRLGTPDPVGAVKRMTVARKARTNQFAANVMPIIREVQAAGYKSCHIAPYARAREATRSALPGGGLFFFSLFA
jgi:Resolvase, N terminal domain